MDADLHALIAKALTGLVKQIKAVRYYPPKHPALLATAEESLKGLQPLLQGTRHFSLTVRKEAFLFDEQPIAKTQQILAQFATFCFARRIQHLTLLPELTSEELHRFIHLLVIDPQKLQRLGGLQSILEKARITHIWLNELDLDAILEKKEIIESQPELDEETLAALISGEPLQSDRPQAVTQDLKTILKKLQQERDDQKFWQLLQEFIPLLRLSLSEQNRGLVLQALSFICHCATNNKNSEARREHSMNALRQLATQDMIDYLVAALLSGEASGKARGALTKVLAFLEEKSTRRIMEFLSREKSAANRKLLAAVLVMSGPSAVPVLQEHLFDDRWYVVRNAIAILGEIKYQDSLVHISPLLQHKDIRVRRETIRAMTKIGGPRAINILLQATNSSDQELRRQALLSLGAIRAASAVPTLIKIVRKTGWNRANVDLKKDAIRSLGEIGSTDAIPVLGKIVSKRQFFHRKSSDELRTAAATALGEIGDDAARDILEKTTHDKSSFVARAATQALQQLDKGTP
jgi:HEAT repeat protein